VHLTSVGSVIAERRLTLSGRSTVSVFIGKPEPFPDGNGFYCPYQIVGFGNERIRRAGGEDTVQALLLALKMIGVDLYTSQEARNGLLTWDAGSGEGDLGFPTPDSARDLAPP
jgi:hypothetical protein